MRLKIKQNGGYSLVELLLGLGLASIIAIAAYEATSKVNLRTVRTVQSIRATQEANKALDRISSEIGNAFSLNNSNASILGNLMTPSIVIGGQTKNTADTSCVGLLTQSPITGSSIKLIPHGFVVLPGRTKNDFDTSTELTLVDPHEIFTSPSESEASDGLRIAYIPLDSRPLTVKTFDLVSSGIDLPNGEDASAYFNVGDFVIIYDTYNRELFRVTAVGVGSNMFYLGFGSAYSYWNTNIQYSNPFSSGATVQKVNVVSYAHDPETQELFRDDHMKDDGFNPTTKVFGAPRQRVANWVVLAKNIQSFHVSEEVTDSSDPSGNTSLIRKNPTAVAALSGCPNEVGYPLFRNALIELGALDENRQVESFSRRATSKNLTRPGGSGDPSQDGDPKILPSATPTDTPVGGPPPPPPLPTGTPGRSF